jgi:alkanesulfonate monooxygenase SsuD/methylene tetrahydromethanopterin reductase-like flavin-dependent oxidoreductase (luciferase family)
LMIEGQEGVTWDHWVALAGACERGGLEGLFRSDHYSSVFGVEGRGSLDAWATINALAAVTERLRLGTMVSPATFRHPSELARVACTADHVSGGRIELGLGAGWNEREHRAFGFSFHDTRTRIALFAEQLEIIHRQWTEDSFSFSGEHYTLEDCQALPRPLQTPHPPLIVGGAAKPGTVGPAVRFADEYNTTYAGPDEARERRARIGEAGERAGRDPSSMTFSIMTGMLVATDRSELLERARRTMLRTLETGDPAAWLAQQKAAGWIAGTVDEVAGQLRALADAGVERFFLQHLDHTDLDTVELLAGEVARALR